MLYPKTPLSNFVKLLYVCFFYRMLDDSAPCEPEPEAASDEPEPEEPKVDLGCSKDINDGKATGSLVA